jgi:hypothetical protein
MEWCLSTGITLPLSYYLLSVGLEM